MDSLEDVKKYELVQIVANNEWKNLVGIVHERTKELLAIFCIQKPTDLYYVGDWNKSDITRFSR